MTVSHSSGVKSSPDIENKILIARNLVLIASAINLTVASIAIFVLFAPAVAPARMLTVSLSLLTPAVLAIAMVATLVLVGSAVYILSKTIGVTQDPPAQPKVDAATTPKETTLATSILKDRIRGTFVYNYKGQDVTLDAEYRFGDSTNKAGYDKCFKIDSGYQYFRDDKFKVEKMEKLEGKLMITLTEGISTDGKLIGPFTRQIILNVQ